MPRHSTVPAWEGRESGPRRLGAVVRVKDVARVELGAQTYDARAELNGAPSAFVVVYQSPGANALNVANLDV